MIRYFLFALALSFGAMTSAQVHPLNGNVSWVEGGGGNSGVIVGDKGVIVIDAKISAETGKALLDEIATITPKPVNTVS